ncbi:hypothetical protein ACJJTC_004836 [Scirpophaga incertulas]
MAALTSLEREAKENVYAVLDPHIQYELTINKHGEPPKYLSLSKPLHQRSHAYIPHNVSTNEINNNDYNENRFSTFKLGPPKARRSYKSNETKLHMTDNYVSKCNNDVEYSRDPFFGIVRESETNVDIHNGNFDHNEYRNSKNYSRMYERNNYIRKGSCKLDQETSEPDNVKEDIRCSNRSFKNSGPELRTREKFMDNDRSFEEMKEIVDAKMDVCDDDKPRPGKVREIASKFNRNCPRDDKYEELKRARPKPLQSYGYQAYLDHVFPDAIEI